MFNPARLTLARQRRKLTKKAFAQALDVDQKTVIRWEDCEVDPPADSVAAIAKRLDFPEPFFFGEDVDEPQAKAVSFRALTTMLARDRDAALASSSIAFMLSDYVDGRFNLPQQDLLDVPGGIDPESAAEMLRQKWGLGIRPIRNVVHLLEAKGVRVFSLAEDTRKLDGISMWRRNIPYVFLNTTKTPERSRFDAAHELAHLCCHKHGGPTGRKAEDQANQFASAFLMPKADILARLPRVTSLRDLVQAKKLWGVSVRALNYRLHALGIVTPWQYRSFWIQIEQQFGNTEPNGIERETSQVWEQILGSLRSDGVSKPKLAESLALPVTEVENLVFGLINMQSIDGKGIYKGKSNAPLKLVA